MYGDLIEKNLILRELIMKGEYEKLGLGISDDEWMERIEEDRKVVERKPWLKGTNWKWEQRAEYTCTKEHHTGRTICRRPYYMN